MEFFESIPDAQTVEITKKKVNFFNQLPRHIKGMVSELKFIDPAQILLEDALLPPLNHSI